MPERGETMTSSIRSLRLNGATVACPTQSDMKAICGTFRMPVQLAGMHTKSSGPPPRSGTVLARLVGLVEPVPDRSRKESAGCCAVAFTKRGEACLHHQSESQKRKPPQVQTTNRRFDARRLLGKAMPMLNKRIYSGRCHKMDRASLRTSMAISGKTPARQV